MLPARILTAIRERPSLSTQSIIDLSSPLFKTSLVRAGFQMRRTMLGKSSQTLTPQKWEPSVQMGVVTPALRWQGGPI